METLKYFQLSVAREILQERAEAYRAQEHRRELDAIITELKAVEDARKELEDLANNVIVWPVD